MSRIVTLKNNRLTVCVSTYGAEIHSITDENGVNRMWKRDPAFWGSSAPVLFPVAGGFKDDCYYLRGVRYDMPKHGFVRKLEWQVEKEEPEQAVFLMTAQHPGFPFPYELRMIYTLERNQLTVTCRVTNKGRESFCYGFGAHEAYATPEGVENYKLIFDEEETFRNYELVGNLIKTEPEIIAENVREFPLKADYFKVDALVFKGLRSRGVRLVNSLNSREIRVDYPDHPVLMLWQKYNAGYICIEPWLNPPDALDSDMQIELKPGCVCLEGGCAKEHTHTITVIG